MSQALRGSAVAVALLLAVAAAHSLRTAARDLAPRPVDIQFDAPPMPGEVARPLAFGFRALLADLTFLEAIQVLAPRKGSLPDEEYGPVDRRLLRLLDYSVEVDPKFAGAYRFAGAALPHETWSGKALGVLAAVSILTKGVRERPDDWHIPFLLGFLQAYYLRDYAAASRNFGIAAQDEGAPGYLPFLATRTGSAGGDLASATTLAEAMLAQANEEDTRREWQERVDLLHMEEDLRAIEGATARWKADRGTLPRTVQALVAAGYLRREPVEPHGGKYLLDPVDGRVRSTGAERLIVWGGPERRLEVH